MGVWGIKNLWQTPWSLGFDKVRETGHNWLTESNDYLRDTLPEGTTIEGEYSVPIGETPAGYYGEQSSSQGGSTMAEDTNFPEYSFEDSLKNAYANDYTQSIMGPDFDGSYLDTDYEPGLEGANIQGSGWMSSSPQTSFYGSSPTKAQDDSLWSTLFNAKTAPLWAVGISSLFNSLSMSEQSKIMNKEADALKRLSDMQLQLFNQGGPIREQVYGQLQGILSGQIDPSTLPQYANYRNPKEQQYAQARKGIESNVRGEGALARALAALEATRASDIGSIPGQMYSDAFAQSLGIANPALAGQQIQSATATRQPVMNMATNLYQQSSQQLGQSGQTLGMILYDQYLTGNA